MSYPASRRSQQGFTIVELLIVIVVIGILAALVVTSFSSAQSKARDAQRKDDVAKIARGLQLWSNDTGKRFQDMNSGNGSAANGWFDADYGGGSIQALLENGKYISPDMNDPLRSASNNSRWRYMLVPCMSDASDNRRVVMAELEEPPSETVAQQLQSSGCNHSQINTYVTVYGMNYVRLVDAR